MKVETCCICIAILLGFNALGFLHRLFCHVDEAMEAEWADAYWD